jgi:hypothetical protein
LPALEGAFWDCLQELIEAGDLAQAVRLLAEAVEDDASQSELMRVVFILGRLVQDQCPDDPDDPDGVECDNDNEVEVVEEPKRKMRVVN